MSPVCLNIPKPKAQFPLHRLLRLKLFSGEHDDHMYIIPTCWGVIGTIQGNNCPVLKASLFCAADTFRDTWSTCFPWLRHQRELTEKAWENTVQGLGKGNHHCLDTTDKDQEKTGRKSPLHSTFLPGPLSFLFLRSLSFLLVFFFRLPSLKRVSWLPYNETRLYLDGFVNFMKLCC